MVYYGSVSQDTRRTNCQLSRALPIILALDRPLLAPPQQERPEGPGPGGTGRKPAPGSALGRGAAPGSANPDPTPGSISGCAPPTARTPGRHPAGLGRVCTDCKQQEPTARPPHANAHRHHHHHRGLDQRQDPAAGAAGELSCSLLAGGTCEEHAGWQ